MSQINKISLDSFKTRRTLTARDKTYTYFSLPDAEKANIGNIAKLPFTLKVLLENLLRYEDGKSVTVEDIKSLASWTSARQEKEIAYRPARVLMQDFTGVPAVADLAAMRDAMANAKRDPNKVNPLTPVDLIIDHSVQVDEFGNNRAYLGNVHIEMQRNHERYEFLRWGQKAFNNFRVVPPGTGICHQVNLEYLAKTIWHTSMDGTLYAYPDTVIGTDSHTTMINGLGVLGWGVGGIEAEAAMLGQPISMLIPEVIGFKLEGKLREGITATDLVLTVTQMLRQKGVVDKFVEFYGPGLDELPLPDRATLANMAPEYGATCGFFPIDHITIDYLKLTGRDEDTLALVEAYAKAQGLWRDSKQQDPIFTDTLQLDLNTVGASLAGPKRPQDRVELRNLATAFQKTFETKNDTNEETNKNNQSPSLKNGDIVIAAITSCTNTSNPSVMLAAGLVAKKACEKGLKAKPWVKSSLAPGSKVVTDYLNISGLQPYLDQLGFNLVGYGCTTCIGNSGPLPEEISNDILNNNIIASAVLSGNRNFEGRIHPQVKANWLASPPLVVALALAGTINIDLETAPIANDTNGRPVYLKDIWPSTAEINEEVNKINSQMFRKEYADVFNGDKEWQAIPISESVTFDWKQHSTYVRKPPFFDLTVTSNEDIIDANILAIFGDSITTDHISPAGSIQTKSPAGQYLINEGVSNHDFNSYGARRGNHEVMMRGTFANIRIKNEMLPGTEGGLTQYIPNNEVLPIYDAAIQYQKNGTPLVIFAGKEYGTGSSRDWAAKGTRLLGIKAVIAESFERIHRSNLIGMGILPLQFKSGMDRKQLGLKGTETITIKGLAPHAGQGLHPRMEIMVEIRRADGSSETFPATCRIDTQNELEYYKAGGILPYVLNTL